MKGGHISNSQAQIALLRSEELMLCQWIQFHGPTGMPPFSEDINSRHSISNKCFDLVLDRPGSARARVDNDSCVTSGDYG
jgi:hypothetical protein